MLPFSAGREASLGVGAPPYVRHRTERALLYQSVEEYYPAFKTHLPAQAHARLGSFADCCDAQRRRPLCACSCRSVRDCEGPFMAGSRGSQFFPKAAGG